MDNVSLSEIRRALTNVPSKDMEALCIRLARYKKENKELLSYLLFEADDEPEYIRNTKADIDLLFADLTLATPYLTKKGLRKILNFTNTRIRYSGKKRTEVELLIHFCKKFRKQVPFRNNLIIRNLFLRQIQKINKSILLLHEDLQFDFGEEVRLLS